MRRPGKLKALNVARTKNPGMYGDGGGLYLQVTSAGAKSWIFRYWASERDAATGDLVRDPASGKVRGTSREMGLGSASVVSLDEARDLAADCRRLRQQSIDPIDARREAGQQAALEKAKALTFKQAAGAYIAAHRAGWRNVKHAGQWEATLSTYAYPAVGALSVQAVDTGLVLAVIEPIWSTKPETASRLRGRIESVLDWAAARGFRKGENPARWRGHLDHLLPAPSKVRRVKHHAALPYDDMSAFMPALRAQAGVAARALEFTILTAARTSDTIGAKWSELNLRDKLWTVPGERMKAGKEHRVPLSEAALEILGEMEATGPAGHPYIFPGGQRDRPLSNMAMAAVLERMGRDDLTVHGFRSTFKDWTSERTNFPGEVAEMALAHAVGDKVEAAYRRGDLFEKRRRLMAEWAGHCAGVAEPGAAVIPIRRSKA
jgi:integrase